MSVQVQDIQRWLRQQVETRSSDANPIPLGTPTIAEDTLFELTDQAVSEAYQRGADGTQQAEAILVSVRAQLTAVREQLATCNREKAQALADLTRCQMNEGSAEEVRRLQAELEDCEKDANRQQQALVDARTKLIACQAREADLKRTNEELLREASTLEAKIRELEQQTSGDKDCKEALAKNLREVSRLQTQLRASREENEKLSATIRRLQASQVPPPPPSTGPAQRAAIARVNKLEKGMASIQGILKAMGEE